MLRGRDRALLAPGEGGGVVPLPTPFLIEAFDSAALFVGLSNATFSDDPGRKVQGASAARIKSTTGSATCFGVRQSQANMDPQTFGVMAWYMDPDPYAVGSVEMQVGRSNGAYGGAPVNEQLGSDAQPRGGRWIARALSEYAALPSGLGNVYTRPRVNTRDAGNAECTFDCFMGNAKGRPTFVITFDDGFEGPLLNALPILDSYGAKASFYIPPNSIGGFGKLTETQCGTLYALGHDLSCDGTNGDNSLLTYANPAAAVAETNSVRAWLVARGWTRAADHLCYPDGDFMAAPVYAYVPAATSDGAASSAITLGAAPATAVTVGMKVYGVGVPAGATVTAVADTTHVTVGALIPITTTKLKFVDESSPFFGRALSDALAAAGFKTGRATLGGSNYTRFGFGQQALQLVGQGETLSSWATIKAHIDSAILRGTTLVWYFHNVTTVGGGIDIATAMFQQIMDYIGPMKQSGAVDILTISQLYARDATTPLPF